eukprot:1157596-Pelagomonas_calceolata.AAC.2
MADACPHHHRSAHMQSTPQSESRAHYCNQHTYRDNGHLQLPCLWASSAPCIVSAPAAAAVAAVAAVVGAAASAAAAPY